MSNWNKLMEYPLDPTGEMFFVCFLRLLLIEGSFSDVESVDLM